MIDFFAKIVLYKGEFIVGLLGPIWRVLGFEDDAKSPPKIKKTKTANSQFVLTDNSYHKQLPTTRNARTHAEVELVLEELKNVKTLIIDLSNFKENRGRSLDFISGAIFALDGELKKIDTDKYYCNLDVEEE